MRQGWRLLLLLFAVLLGLIVYVGLSDSRSPTQPTGPLPDTLFSLALYAILAGTFWCVVTIFRRRKGYPPQHTAIEVPMPDDGKAHADPQSDIGEQPGPGADMDDAHLWERALRGEVSIRSCAACGGTALGKAVCRRCDERLRADFTADMRMDRVRLRCTHGASEGKVWESETKLQVGRAGDLEIAVDDRPVSRRHAEIFPAEGRWYVRDLGSTNGSFLNGIRLTADAVRLRPGDWVQFASTVFVVEWVGPAERPDQDDNRVTSLA